MMRSLYSAISGLKNHQIKMDVIGNNIANVNTAGYKRSRVSFATALSQTMQGASASTPNQGGTNAVQVGLGVLLGSIDQIMTPGSAQSTGNPTDLMLKGSGFFVLNNNGRQVYTRSGAFGQDDYGTLIDPASGAKVQGFSWGADDTAEPAWGAASDIRFKLGDILATDSGMPIATDTISLSLDSDGKASGFTPEVAGSPATYDADVLKGAVNVTVKGMTQVASNPTTGQFTFNPADGTITFASGFVAPKAPDALEISYVDPAKMGAPSISANTATVDFPPAPGAIVYNNGATPPAAYKLSTSSIPGDLEYTVKAVGGKYLITFGTDGASPPEETVPTAISYDFTNKAHVLTSFSIDPRGVITGVYNNGTDSVTHKIAQIAVASFANEGGLANVGGNFYEATNNSGAPSIGAPGDDGRAGIASNTIEMSNVDLSTEFTDMIVTQRGFQANSRVITVSDTLLEELINLKR